MFKFIGRALAGLVLTRDAQKAVGQINANRRKDKPKSGAVARDQVIADAQAQAKDLVTPDRAELIRQAMQVRTAKQTILANLDDETRGKLVATALKALLNESRPKE